MLRKLRTFLALPAPHRRIFAKIALLVPALELAVRALGFRRTYGLLRRFSRPDGGQPVDDEKRIVYRHMNYLHLYERQFFSFGNCLARSLAVWFLLTRRGIEVDLQFGMKKDVNGSLLAHAWLEHKGEPLITASEKEEQYVPFSEPILTRVLK